MEASKHSFSLVVDGMHCGGCVKRVHKALEDIPGVTVDKVEVGTAAGSFDEADTDLQEIVGAIKKVGYDAKPA